MVLSDSLSVFVHKIDGIINATIDSTVLLSRDIGALLAQVQDENQTFLLDPSLKKAIQKHIKQTLKSNAFCSGAGFASHMESTDINSEYWLLEWWYKKAGGVKQVSLDLDQATQQRLDFRTFAWFKQSPQEGRAYIHGPYVDYICNTAYTLTSAIPVYLRGRFIGVVAIDVLVSRVEEELLPYFNNNRVVLTNSDRRIIFSTVPKYRVGELLNPADFTLVWQTDYTHLYQFDKKGP